jgi:F-type H+-transporting ATPase subunit b
MPQLDFSTFPNQIFWLVVTLVVIYLILSRVALPRIGAVLAQRRGTITNDIAAAEDLSRKAAEAEEARLNDLAEARAQAAKIVDQMKAEIQAELAEALAQADEEIGAKTADSERRIGEIRASAQESVAEVARDVAKDIVTMLGGKADGRTVTAAVNARMRDGGAA